MGFIKKIIRKSAPLLVLIYGILIIAMFIMIDDAKQSVIVLMAGAFIGMLFSHTGWYKQNVLGAIRSLYWRVRLNSGKYLRIGPNVKFLDPGKITFGEKVDIAEGVAFCPLVAVGEKKYPSEIVVGDRVHFGSFDRIASMNKVTIEDDVLFAAFVHVTDHSHEYRNAGIPVWKQGVYSDGPVVIKKGAWLGFGCHVLSGVTIGEYSIVGANSTVTKSIPPYSVAVGTPARVVKQYNFDTQKWESVK